MGVLQISSYKHCKSISSTIFSPNLSIRQITESLFKRSKVPPTATQSIYARDFGVNLKTIWKTIHNLPVSCKVKSLTWQIYSKTLPLFHSDKQHNQNLESTT